MSATQPSDWIDAIESVAVAAIQSVEPFKVAKVFYEANVVVGPDECCKGVLVLDAATWNATGEWPRPRDPSGPSDPCGGAAVLNITLKYASCVSTLNGQGKMPPAPLRKSQQMTMLDLGWTTWLALLTAERTTWRRNVGTARIGIATRLPPSGGCDGFTIMIQTKLGVCT